MMQKQHFHTQELIQNCKAYKKRFQLKHILSFLVMCFFITACSSTPSVEEPADSSGEALPDSAQIDFNPSGSDSGEIEGLYTIHFEYDQSTLTDEAKQRLNQNMEWIRKNGDVSLQLEGHCDKRGSLEYNLALGERRAQTIKSYLIGLGATPQKLNIISFGEEKLLSEGDSEADHVKNRRVNFLPMR